MSTNLSVTDSALILASFRALSDPIRFQVVELLKSGEMCVCDLCEEIGVSQSKLSFHLKNLKQASLVRPRQEGRWIYYSLNLPQFIVLEQYLAEYRRNTVLSQAKCCPD
ncbi:MAG: metalloregulator ArsR/SmtB family transcription factor [Oscillatoria sp. PMC 1068.18]|nr:metalloregulator ArsR/SmtB family transcription factor [Oscillatoria sp. PMC 1068.18]